MRKQYDTNKTCEPNCQACEYARQEESVEKRRKLGNMFYAIQLQLIPGSYQERQNFLQKYQAQGR